VVLVRYLVCKGANVIRIDLVRPPVCKGAKEARIKN